MLTSEFMSLRDTSAKSMLEICKRIKFQSSPEQMNVVSICRALNFGDGSDAAEGEVAAAAAVADASDRSRSSLSSKEKGAVEVEVKEEATESVLEKLEQVKGNEESLRAFLGEVSPDAILTWCEEVKKNEHFPAYQQFLLQKEGVDDASLFGSEEMGDPLEDLVQWGLWIAQEKPDVSMTCYPYKQMIQPTGQSLVNGNAAGTETEKARSTARLRRGLERSRLLLTDWVFTPNKDHCA